MPNSVQDIDCCVFSNCTSLTSVTLPNTVQYIGYYAFAGCTALTSVTIPNSVRYIAFNLFDGCTGLTSVTIPNSVQEIWDRAFEGCTNLTSVTIPNSVSVIDKAAFFDCSGLTSVTIPNSLTSIEADTFNGCSGLTSVTIGTSVETIGDSAFSGCSSLPEIVVPSSVETIGESAFAGNSNLATIFLGQNVKTIGEKAFDGCPVRSVSITAPIPPTASSNIFMPDVYDSATLSVPQGAMKRYATGTPWNYFNNIEEKNFNTISVNSLSFNRDSYTAEAGETLDLNNEVKILPEDATERTLTWGSSDESVATVSNGVVSVLAEGTCEITATTTDGSNLSAVCTINAVSSVDETTVSASTYDVYSFSGIILLRDATLREVNCLHQGMYIIRQGRSAKKITVK